MSGRHFAYRGIGLEVEFSILVTVDTKPAPAPEFCAVVVGQFHGSPWVPSNGFVNTDDYVAVIQGCQEVPPASHLTRDDLEPKIPNKIVHFSDVVATVAAFAGASYLFSDPTDCP